MRPGNIVFALGFALGVLLTPEPALSRSGYTKGVANAALVAAAKATPLRLIDYDEDRCRNGRTVAHWLAELTRGRARRIVWTGGPCELVTDLNPMDSGSDWCAQAHIVLLHPKTRDDEPMVEIFFDRPRHGRPSPAYAFRAFFGSDEGLIRFRREFEAAWVERFPEAKAVIRCPGDDD